MANSALVIITREGDEHLPFVQQHLSQKMILIDPYQIARGKLLSFGMVKHRAFLEYDGKLLNDVRSVWFRKPGSLELHKIEVARAYKQYTTTAIERHVEMIRSSFRQARWMSDYFAIKRASSKAYQMRVAADAGFRIPDTILTSDPRAAKQFIDKHREIIVKSLASEFPVIDDQLSFFFSKKLAKAEVKLSNLHLAPAIFQQAIDTVLDLRVTVVGNKVFAASIDACTEPNGVRDWRHTYPRTCLFRPYKLIRAIEKQCIQLTHKLGLQFGAIDLLIDKKEQIWFLEINPNGQWAFVEEDTGLEIGKAIAEFLDHKSTI